MNIPAWQYHEPDHPGADFDALAEVYDQDMQKHRDVQREIAEILDFLVLGPNDTVLEIGTGTGEFALAAARHCRMVYAVDLSPGMLRYAGKKAASRAIRNVEFLPGGFLTYQHQGAALDAVVTQIALHHLPDFWKQVALLRISDMLKEGGKFCLRDVVYSFDPRVQERFFGEFISEVSKKSDAEATARISDHIRKEYSTMDWIMQGMIERAGFKIEKAEYSHGFLGLYLCTKT
jgi:putative AdoMet-dependent methyltransferase